MCDLSTVHHPPTTNRRHQSYRSETTAWTPHSMERVRLVASNFTSAWKSVTASKDDSQLEPTPTVLSTADHSANSFWGGHLEVIERLLAAGAGVHASPSQSCGRPALPAASEGGHLAVVERLHQELKRISSWFRLCMAVDAWWRVWQTGVGAARRFLGCWWVVGTAPGGYVVKFFLFIKLGGCELVQWC